MTVSALRRAPLLMTAAAALILVAGCDRPADSSDASDDSTDNTITADTESGGTPITVRGPRPIATRSLDVPDSGIALGWGWNSQEDVAVPTVCVEFAPAEVAGQDKYMNLREVQDSYEVMQSMGMSAGVSVKTIGVSASGKAAFAKNTKVTGFSSSFLLEATVDNGVRFAAPVPSGRAANVSYLSGDRDASERQRGAIRLTPEALQLAQRRDLTAFQDRCGHAFVSAVFGGARLFSVITIEARTHSEQEEISGQMSGSGWGVHVESNFKDVKTSNGQSRNVSMRFFQSGGRGDSIPTNQEDLTAKLAELAALADTAPEPFRMTVTPYTALANWPDRPLSVDVSEFEQLASTWGAYNTLYDEIETALENTCLFQVYDPVKGQFVDLAGDALQGLQTMQDEIHAALREMGAAAAACSQPETGCRFAEGAYLDPYGYRIRMPMPKPNVKQAVPGGACTADAGRKDAANSIDLLVEYYVRDSAKRRCAIDALNPGCLSNAEIAAWKDRIGREVLKVADVRIVDRLAADQPRLTRPVEDSDPVAVWYEPMPGTRFVWYEREGSSVVEALVGRMEAALNGRTMPASGPEAGNDES